MNKVNFQKALAFLQGREADLEHNERQYKLLGAEKARTDLEAFVEGWNPVPSNLHPQPLNLLNWRLVDALTKMVKAHPQVFRNALENLWKTANADQFWASVDPALDSLEEAEAKNFRSVPARASVASYFLFVKAPEKYPYYKPSYGGKAVKFIYGEHMDDRSPGTLLTEYFGRCDHLRQRLEEGGVGLRDALDLQGSLFLIVDELIRDRRAM